MRKKQEELIRNAKMQIYQTKKNDVKSVKNELVVFRNKKQMEDMSLTDIKKERSIAIKD